MARRPFSEQEIFAIEIEKLPSMAQNLLISSAEPPECKGFKMSAKKQTSPEPHSSDDATSNNRRNLLKAAASMAPFVGTLPSGAALANASSVQCALFQQAEAAQGRPNPISTSTDTYYRVPAKQWSARLPPEFQPVTVYQFTALDYSTVVRVHADGNNIEIPAPPTTNRLPVQQTSIY